MKLTGNKGTSGQMAVELAVLMPVISVVALVVYNLARFVSLCATFDRVSMDAVLCGGVAPSGAQTVVSGVEEVKQSLVQAMGNADSCEVEVRAEKVRSDGGSAVMSLAPALTSYTCTLKVRPWPSAFVLAGTRYDAPLVLRHERTLVIDRYKPGVVV